MGTKNDIETFDKYMIKMREKTVDEILRIYVIDNSKYDIQIIMKNRDYVTKRIEKLWQSRYRFSNLDNNWHDMEDPYECHSTPHTTEQFREFLKKQMDFASWYEIEDDYKLVSTYGCVMFILYI